MDPIAAVCGFSAAKVFQKMNLSFRATVSGPRWCGSKLTKINRTYSSTQLEKLQQIQLMLNRSVNLVLRIQVYLINLSCPNC